MEAKGWALKSRAGMLKEEPIETKASDDSKVMPKVMPVIVFG